MEVAAIVAAQHRNREPLIHCAVYIELMAATREKLRDLQAGVISGLTLDPEGEQPTLTRELGGCYLDLMSGEYLIAYYE